jgi:proline dehydrogenase
MSKNLILPFYRLISKRYIAGETIENVIKQQIDLTQKYPNPKKIGLIIDYVDEGKNPNKYFKECITAAKTQYILPSMIAVKCSGLGLGSYNQGTQISLTEIMDKLECIASIAFENGNHIIIDAEQVRINDEINYLTDTLISGYHNQQIFPSIYRTFQMYRNDSFQDLQDYVNKFPYGGIKLVRGAYLEEDKDTRKLFTNKQETDDNYNNAIRYLADYNTLINPEIINHNILIASHNQESCQLAGHYNFKEDKFQFAQLLGMSDNLTQELNKKHMTYKYIPYGPLDEAIPYLTRRLQENAHMIKHMLS